MNRWTIVKFANILCYAVYTAAINAMNTYRHMEAGIIITYLRLRDSWYIALEGEAVINTLTHTSTVG